MLRLNNTDLLKDGIVANYIPDFDGYGTDGVAYAIDPSTGIQMKAKLAVVDMNDIVGDITSADKWEMLNSGGDEAISGTTFDNTDHSSLWSIAHTMPFKDGYDDATLLLDIGLTDDLYFEDNITIDANIYLEVTFDVARMLNQFRWTQKVTSTHGQWKAEGFDGTDWITLNPIITLGGNACSEYTLDGGTAEFTKFRIVGISGVTDATPWLYSINFK